MDQKISSAMKKLLVLFGVFAFLGFRAGAWANSLSGTLYSNNAGGYAATDTSGGMVAINALEGQLAWTVTLNDNGTYTYTYTYTPQAADKNRGPGAISIQFGSLPSTFNSSLTYDHYFDNLTPPAVAYPSLSSGLQTIDRTLAGAAPAGASWAIAGRPAYDSWLTAGPYPPTPANNPVNVSTTFQGLQWILNANSPQGSSFTLTFTAPLVPVWGNFYIDGYNTTTNNGYGMARNTSYDTASAVPFSFTGTPPAGYIPTPGLPPSDITVNPTSFAFGSVEIGKSSTAQTFTVTNTGGVSFTVGTLDFTGANPSEFAIVPGTDACSGTAVAPGGSCTVGVALSPASPAGPKSATLHIPSNASNSTDLSVGLSGTGVAGQVYSVPLSSGWNLISLPAQPTDDAIGSVLEPIAGSYSALWGYAGGLWQLYDPNPTAQSSLSAIDAGKGFWILMTDQKILQISGFDFSSSVPLTAGWNLVGYNGTSCATAASSLSSITSGLQIAWGYQGQSWQLYDPSDPQGSTLAQLCPGNGYWIKVRNSGTWQGR